MIFTFYSYKGGVGRSMALANVAHWLYLRGLNVVLVDWDLEAPGLETFFYRSEEEVERVRAHLGVIDLLSAYRRQFPHLPPTSPFGALPGIESHVCEVQPSVELSPSAPAEAARGRLRLVTAGWRSGNRFAEYAETVQSFDWAGFYARYRGEEYFNWLRGQLDSLGHVVLIDSRTGVSEMSGVCTRQLADVVVVMVAPNFQNLRGALDMVGSFVSKEVEQARGRPLQVVILPSRVDDADSKGYEEFRKQFVSQTGNYTPPVFHEWKCEPWNLAIPYKAQYSYRECLVAGVRDPNELLEQAYKDLAAHMALFASVDDPLWMACERELKVLAARAGKEIAVSPWRGADAALDRSGQADRARPVLLRLVNLSAQAPALDTRRRASRDEFEHPEAEVILEQLASIGVVSRTPEDKMYELAHESFAKTWPRLRQWIDSQRPFLLWRQDLAGQARKWRDSGRDEAVLLRGTTLEDARGASSGHAGQLNALEAEFLASSIAAEEVRRQAVLELEEQVQRAVEVAELQRRRALEEAERERRRRRLRLAVTVSSAVVVLLAGIAWSLWSRSDAHQVDRAVAEGAQLEFVGDGAQAWRAALILSGRASEALADIRKIPSGPGRAGALANAAAWLSRCGTRPDAERVAAEALDLPQVGLSPEDYAQSMADVLARLYGGGLGPYPAEDLLAAVRKLESPEARLAALRGLVSFPGQDQVRLQYFDAASLMKAPKEQAEAFLWLVEAAREQDARLVRQAAEQAVKAAERTPDALLRARTLLALARLDPVPERWRLAAGAARAVTFPDSREAALAAVARALRPIAPRDAEPLWREAFDLASKLPPPRSLDVSTNLLDQPDNWSREAASHALGVAPGIQPPSERARALAALALQASRVGLVDDARAAAEAALKASYAEGYPAETLTRVTPLLPDDARAAAEAALKASYAGGGLPAETLTRMIPLLPEEPGRVLAKKIATPQAWLALAKHGRSGDLDAARRAAEALSPGPDKSNALALVAKAYARRGELRTSRSLAQTCESPGDKLSAYAAILAAHAFASRPELRKIPEAALFD